MYDGYKSVFVVTVTGIERCELKSKRPTTLTIIRRGSSQVVNINRLLDRTAKTDQVYTETTLVDALATHAAMLDTMRTMTKMSEDSKVKLLENLHGQADSSGVPATYKVGNTNDDNEEGKQPSWS